MGTARGLREKHPPPQFYGYSHMKTARSPLAPGEEGGGRGDVTLMSCPSTKKFLVTGLGCTYIHNNKATFMNKDRASVLIG